MLATGLRRSEVDLDDYNIRNGQLVVMSEKGNKQRVVFIQTDARRLIKPWIDCRGKDVGKFFHPISNKNDILYRGMNCQSLYDLRRSFVTRLLEFGLDINTVRQLAGHSDIQITARYDLRYEKEQRKAVKQASFFIGVKNYFVNDGI